MNSISDSVRIVLFDETAEHFIALAEADDPDNLKLPGGKFEGEETPQEAAYRELKEELGITSDQIELTLAGELVNDDKVSKRFIFTGKYTLESVQPSSEIQFIKLLTSENVPAGKNREHILSAVVLSRKIN